MINILIVYALVASVYIAQKVLLITIPPIFLTGISALIGGLLLIMYSIYSKTFWDLWSWKRVQALLIPAFCITYGAMILRLYALSRMSAARVSFFSIFDPFITALLCFLIQGKRITIPQWVGMVIAVFGAVPMLVCNVNDIWCAFELFSLPVIAIIISIVINRYGWIRLQHYVSHAHMAVLQENVLLLLLGGMMAMATAPYIEGLLNIPIVFPSIALILYVAIVNYIVCSISYIQFIKTYSITLLSLADFLIPIFVVLYSVILFRETVTIQFFASLLLVFFGVFIFLQQERKSK